jgi:hypothetical protein
MVIEVDLSTDLINATDVLEKHLLHLENLLTNSSVKFRAFRG